MNDYSFQQKENWKQRNWRQNIELEMKKRKTTKECMEIKLYLTIKNETKRDNESEIGLEIVEKN